MAAIKASVNLFSLLDGNDPGDKRLADLDPKHKDQPKKKPVSAVACDYKLKLMKQPSPPAPAARKSPTPAVPAGLRSAPAPRNNPKPAIAAGLRSAAEASMARSMNKQTTTTPAPPPARNTNLTSVLFAYPSARERIFKQRKERMEEYERRQAQAKAAENSIGSGLSGDDGKSAAAPAGAPLAGNGKGKKEAPVPTPARAKEPVAAPVVLKTPPPPAPRLEDIVQFPSLK